MLDGAILAASPASRCSNSPTPGLRRGRAEDPHQRAGGRDRQRPGVRKAFGVGTAASIAPVGGIVQTGSTSFTAARSGRWPSSCTKELQAIQYGEKQDLFGWNVVVPTGRWHELIPPHPRNKKPAAWRVFFYFTPRSGARSGQSETRSGPVRLWQFAGKGFAASY